jgi:hypothetical protein
MAAPAFMHATMLGVQELHITEHEERYIVGCPNLLIVLLPTLAVQRAIDIRVIYMESLRRALYDTYITSLEH